MNKDDNPSIENLLDLKFLEVGDSSFESRGRAVAYLSPNDDKLSYAICYKKAGDLLVHEVVANSEMPDILVYPVIFLYRHYIELSLKDFCCRIGNEPKFRHGLYEVWKLLREFIDEEKDDAGCDAVESFIKEWDRYDSRSTRFRYPTKKDDLKSVDLENMSEQITKLENFFLGLDGFLSDVDMP